MSSWSRPIPAGQAYKRAGGRRHLNSQRRIAMLKRRIQVTELAKQYGIGRGQRSRFAKLLGVSKRTMSADFHALFGPAGRCPSCGASLRRVDHRAGTPGAN
jgi:hypothetical protein